MEPTKGVPSWLMHTMDREFIEQTAGHRPGSFVEDPDRVYLDFQRTVGTCMIDQFIAANVLTMDAHGLQGKTRGATTGGERIERNGIVIDSAEAVQEHLERFVFPSLQKQIEAPEPDNDDHIDALIEEERRVQKLFGPNILKVPYGGAFSAFPRLRYSAYGYYHYLTTAMMYPDLAERDFELQGKAARRANARAARAFIKGAFPPVLRSDHDMAFSQGPLLPVTMLDEIWFPHFIHAIEPLLDAGVRIIWHCDGDLSQMVPRLVKAGLSGFQGFQYEDNMDYVSIASMKDNHGEPLMIWAGVSVTTTLPFGTTEDVHQEIDFLVANGPERGLFLGASSSITPGVPHENLRAMIDGLRRHRERS
jgi:hypothetical protein